MRILFLILFFSTLLITSCTTLPSRHRKKNKQTKLNKKPVKINGETISSNGVEIINEESNQIIESNVNIKQYENLNEERSNTSVINYSEKINNSGIENKEPTTSNNQKSKNLKIISPSQISKKDLPKDKKEIRKEKSESNETFIIAKSEISESPFGIANKNIFSNPTINKLSNSDIILKQVKAAYLLGKNKQAIDLLKNNWNILIDSEKNLKSLENSPIAEAFFLKGKINLAMAEKSNNLNSAKEKYQIAIKSFYIVLSKYNARRCSFSSESIKLFRKCRNIYFKKYNVKIGFPPEF
jgi:hypothetical protein